MSTVPAGEQKRSGPTGPDRRVLAACCALSLLAFGAALWWLTPWHPLGAEAPPVRPNVEMSFSDEEISRWRSFRQDVGPWGVISTAVLAVIPWVVWWVLGRWDSGARKAVGQGVSGDMAAPALSSSARSRPVRRQWWLIAGTVAAVSVLLWLVALPQALHSETVLRRFGLSTQQWPGWLRDEAVEWGMTLVVTVAAVMLLWWVIRRLPRAWPYAVALAAAAVTVLGSLVWPVVVEPAFHQFRPLPAGELRHGVEELVTRGGFAPMEILVADASTRTSAHNAYVSGLGATRRVVLYDTLVAAAAQSPQEREAVLTVVAHELAHVSNRDVARGTAVGALGVLTAVLLLALGATSAPGRRAFRPQACSTAPVVRSVVLLLAVATTVQWAATPVSTLVSRRIEAAADVGALELTGDPPAFQRMQHDLAVTNLSRLEDEPAWWRTAFFATHPSAPWRIAQAQVWAELDGGTRGPGSAR